MVATAVGEYNHATYLTRQQIVTRATTAGATTTNTLLGFPLSNMRLRAGAAIITAASTAASTFTCLNGTNSVGQFIVSSSGVPVGTLITVPDMNTTLNQGTMFSLRSGADATVTCQFVVEAHVDPASVFSGNP